MTTDGRAPASFALLHCLLGGYNVNPHPPTAHSNPRSQRQFVTSAWDVVTEHQIC